MDVAVLVCVTLDSISTHYHFEQGAAITRLRHYLRGSWEPLQWVSTKICLGLEAVEEQAECPLATSWPPTGGGYD